MTAELVEGYELHLYVLEIVDCGVKVGVTANPQQRFAEHRRGAEAFNREVGRVWISAPHVEARKNERKLVELAGPDQRREYLPLPFDEVTSVAEALVKTRMDPAEATARQDAATRMLKSTLLGSASSSPLDVLKYVVSYAHLHLEDVDGHDEFLRDLDWMLSPFGGYGADLAYGDGSPVRTILTTGSGRQLETLHLPPRWKQTVALGGAA